MSKRTYELARELVDELEKEFRLREPRCCICNEPMSNTSEPRHWLQNGSDGSRRFHFCERDWDNVVMPHGISWHNGSPVFWTVFRRGQPPP